MLISDFLYKILKRFTSEGFRLGKVNNFVTSLEFFEIGLHFHVSSYSEGYSY